METILTKDNAPEIVEIARDLAITGSDEAEVALDEALIDGGMMGDDDAILEIEVEDDAVVIYLESDGVIRIVL